MSDRSIAGTVGGKGKISSRKLKQLTETAMAQYADAVSLERNPATFGDAVIDISNNLNVQSANAFSAVKRAFPPAFMNVPAGQLVQVACSAVGWTVPGLQGIAMGAPVGQKCPVGHSSQSSALVIEMLSAAIVPFWCRPDGHGSAADAPASQYEPATHSKHAVSPGPDWYLPASHLAHDP